MRGTIYKKRDRYYGVFDIGRDPATGKRRQKTIGGFITKREAQRALNDAVNQIQKGTYSHPTRETTGEYLRRFIDTYVAMRCKPSVQQSYKFYD